jgi:hypothetical protein
MDGNPALERYSGRHIFNILKFNKIIIIIDYQHIILRSDETRIVTTEMPDRMIFYTLDYTYLYREKLYFLALSPAFD